MLPGYVGRKTAEKKNSQRGIDNELVLLTSL